MEIRVSPDIHVGLLQAEKICFQLKGRYRVKGAEGKHISAHFALTTGFMALGMMIPGMISGWLQEMIGYQHFFIWVMICTISGFIVIPFLKIDPEFGRKGTE